MRVCAGKSVATMLRNVGLAAAPDAGPISAVFLLCVFKATVSVPLLVTAVEAVAESTVPSPVKVTLVTVPPPPVVGVQPVALPLAVMPRA